MTWRELAEQTPKIRTWEDRGPQQLDVVAGVGSVSNLAALADAMIGQGFLEQLVEFAGGGVPLNFSVPLVSVELKKPVTQLSKLGSRANVRLQGTGNRKNRATG